jgi:hypothetical protein
LYVGVGDEMYVFEAKQFWINVVNEGLGKFSDGIDRAIQGVKLLAEDEGIRVAICFAVPNFKQSSKIEAIKYY